MPRPLPATWKEPMHAPASLPATYRPLLSTIKPLALGTVFGAPALSKPVPRPANAHLLLAQRGDAVIRTVLLDIGADLGLTLSGRHVSPPAIRRSRGPVLVLTPAPRLRGRE